MSAVISKINKLLIPSIAVSSIFCAVSLILMLRLAGKPRLGVRCLTYAFTAATALCALAATAIYPALHLENLSLSPASVKQLVLTYFQNLFGRFGLFALVYGAVAVILLALVLTAGSRKKRRQNI